MKTRTKKTAIGHFLDELDNEELEYESDLATEDAIYSRNKNEPSTTIVKKTKKKPSVLPNLQDELYYELPSGKKVKLTPKIIDPNTCIPWTRNSRLQELLNEENTQELRDKIKTQGQLVPILVRISKDPKYKYDVIYGTRRLFVCKSLDLKIKALVADLDDLDSLYFMDAENSGREKPSPYEVGISYKQWLKDGLFKNQIEIAKKFGTTREWTNKVIRISKIPIEIMQAFKSPEELAVKKGLKLLQYIESLTIKEKDALIKKALSLKSKGLETKEVLDQLYTNKKDKPIPHSYATASSSRYFEDVHSRKICKIVTKASGQVSIVFEKNIQQNDIDVILEKMEKSILEL